MSYDFRRCDNESEIRVTKSKNEVKAPVGSSHVASLLGINSISNRNIRRIILVNAVKELERENNENRDERINAKVVTTLTKSLTFDLERGAQADDIQLICAILLKLFTCSDNQAAKTFKRESFKEVGSQLIPLLFLVIEMNYRLGAKQRVKTANRIIQSFSKMSISLEYVAEWKGLVQFFLDIINGTSGKTTVHTATSVLASLSRNGENKTILAKFPGVLDTLTDVSAKYMYGDTRMEAAFALMNLSWDVSNKGLMVKHKSCIDTLIDLSEDPNHDTSCAALDALAHLTGAAENKVLLAHRRGGLLLDTLLAFAADASRHRTCVAATRAVANLANQRTASRMGNHPGLLGTLAHIGADCPHEDAACLAATAVKRLATHLNIKEKNYGKLLLAMVKMTSSEFPEVLVWVAKAFASQASILENKAEMVGYSGLIGSLLSLVRSPHLSVKEPALKAMAALALQADCAIKIAGNFIAIQILVGIAAGSDAAAKQAARRHAIKALLSLVTHKTISQRMAKQEGLVETLSRYGLSKDTDTQLKHAATHGVVLLAPYL